MSGFARRHRRAARGLTVLGTALAALGLATSASVGADAHLRSPASTLGTPNTLSLGPTVVTCATPYVPLYHVDSLAQLRRWSYAAPLDGSSGWLEQMIGTGWNGLPKFLSPGDWNGDNLVDLIGITPSGDVRLYTSNGHGGWINGRGIVIDTGWAGYNMIF